MYKTARSLGLEVSYMTLLFKVRKLFGIKSKDEKSLLDFYFSFLGKEKKLIFDIGANVGVRTSVFSEISEKVIALEPNKELVNILKSRFSDQNVLVLEKACASVSSVSDFYLGSNHLVSSLSVEFIRHKSESGSEFSWDKKTQVQTCTIDDLIQEFGFPDFCKIDIEGYEKDALKGLSQRIGMISFEFNYPSFEQETLWCLEKLKGLGYSSFNFSMGESLKFFYPEWVTYEEISKLFRLENHPFKNGYGDIYAS